MHLERNENWGEYHGPIGGYGPHGKRTRRGHRRKVGVDPSATQIGQRVDILRARCGSRARNYDTAVISLSNGRITHEGCRAGSGLLAFRHRPGLRSRERAGFFGEHTAIAALVARSAGLPI